MLVFLAGVIEQLDLALEHIGKGHVHDARFGLMLTDNALELVLHQIVKDKRAASTGWRLREEPYPHEKQMMKALLGSFSDKVAFARLEGGMDATSARTFNVMHDYRNHLYHAGLAHEPILLALSRFYFHAACTYIARFEVRGFGWVSESRMPDWAKRYFGRSDHLPGTREEFSDACRTMAAKCGHDPEQLIDVLADDLDRIIEDVDVCIGIVADGVYEGQQTTRDKAVCDTQAWRLAFDDEGEAFLRDRRFGGNMLQAIDLLAAEYPFRFPRDPVPRWRAMSAKLGGQGDPHLALDQYHSFVKSTGTLRESLERSAAAAEAEIEAASDRMRGR